MPERGTVFSMRALGRVREAIGTRLTVVAACGLLLALGAASIGLAGSLGGTSGADQIRGTQGNDKIYGKAGGDRLSGRGGDDLLRGGPGADLIVGGSGNDRFGGGKGRDGFGVRNGVLLGSPGNDVIDARDSVPDEIDCAAGFDKVFVDEVEDGVFNCEKVIAPDDGEIGEHVPPPPGEDEAG